MGAAVGEAAFGKKLGNKALLWGAVLGTIPDLDVLLPYATDVDGFTKHRGFSHSLLVLLLISPLFVWLMQAIHPVLKPFGKRCFMGVYLVLSTHALLDAMTIYGTQLLWPLTEYPFALSNIFIIDPLYTVPLLIGVIVAMRFNWRDQRPRAVKINTYMLILSTGYLLFSVAAKMVALSVNEQALVKQNIAYERITITPAPLTTLLWKTIVVTEDEYLIGYYSVFDKGKSIRYERVDHNHELIDVSAFKDIPLLQRLQWFSKGFYKLDVVDGQLIFSDLRMGVAESYVFQFVVGEEKEGILQPVDNIQFNEEERNRSFDVGDLFRRILDQDINI